MPFLHSRLVSIPSKLLWRFPKGSSTMMKQVPNSQQHAFEGVVWVLERYLHTLVHDPNWNFMEIRWPTSVHESALGRFADPLLKVDSDSRTVWVLWCLPIHIKYHKSPEQNTSKYLSKFNYTMTTPMIDKLLLKHIIRSISDLQYIRSISDLSISANSSIEPLQPPQSPLVCDARSTAGGPPHSPRARRRRLHGTWGLDQAMMTWSLDVSWLSLI